MTVSYTVTALADAAPCPRVEVLIDGLDPAVASLTLWRVAEGRQVQVRGAVKVPVSSGFQILDVEAGFQVDTQYRAELFDADGNSLGFTANSATVVLDVDATWVHNPVDPAGAVQIDLSDRSAQELSRPIGGTRYEVEQRTLAVFVTSRRSGLIGVDLFFSTADPQTAAAFEAMLGDYTTVRVPILCVRTAPFLDIPRTFYAAVLSPTRKPVNVHMGGSLIEWDAQADEAAPPFPGIVIPLLSRDDVDAAYATRDLLDAAYPTRLDIDRDYSLVGTS